MHYILKFIFKVYNDVDTLDTNKLHVYGNGSITNIQIVPNPIRNHRVDKFHISSDRCTKNMVWDQCPHPYNYKILTCVKQNFHLNHKY